MVRLFLTPNFSPVNTLMQCTPWVSVKVTPQRDVIPVGLIQRIATLGLCLLFWKTLLPLSIGFAVWYQLSEARNEQIQDEIELIAKDPGLLASTELLEETRRYLARQGEKLGFNPFDAGDAMAAAAFKELSLDDLRKYIYASKLSGDLPLLTAAVERCEDDKRFCYFANKYPVRALGIDVMRVKKHIADPAFQKRDEVTASAFKELPLDKLKAALTEIIIPQDLFDEDEASHSLLVQAVAECKDLGRLGLFADHYPLWALEHNPQLTAQLNLNFFDESDELAALALERLPIDALGKAITASTIPPHFFEDPSSLFACTVATCEDSDALQALAQKYPEQTLRLVPVDRWHLLGDGAHLNGPKHSVKWELDTLRIHELSGLLEEGRVTLCSADMELIERLYECCNQDQRRNLLDSIHDSPEYLNELPPDFDSYPLDFSFVDDAWFSIIFPQLNAGLKRSILFSGEFTNYINQKRVLAHAPLYSWKGFAEVHVPTPEPETPRGLIRSLCRSLCGSTSYRNDRLITHISLEQFQAIFTSYEGDILSLIEVVAHYHDKVHWLIETYKPDPKEVAPVLASRRVRPESIVQISEDLACKEELLLAFHDQCPIPNLADLLSPTPHEKGVDEPSPVEGASGVEGFLKSDPQKRKAFYKRLVDQETSAEAVAELRGKAAPTVKSAVEAETEARQADGGTSARDMLYLLLDTCAAEEMPALCEIAPAPVLTYHAFNGADDFSALITEESVAALGNDLQPVAQLLCEKKRHSELLTLAQFDKITTLIPGVLERSEFYKALTPAQLGQIAQQMDRGDIMLTINSLGGDARLALFKARPIDTLQVGGAPLAQEVRDTEEWRAQDTRDLLSVLPLDVVVGHPITKESLQAALSTCHDTPPESILDALETIELIDWAMEVLSAKAGAALITEKVRPTEVECLKALIGRDTAEREGLGQLREALLQKYAHKIQVSDISLQLLCHMPKRALFALKNTSLSPEQRTAFVCAGAASADVINTIRKENEYVLGYVTNIHNLNPIHLWLAVEEFGDDVSLLGQIGMFDRSKTFPMPEGEKQWHCALQVEAFREALVSLISKWKISIPGKYESERQNIVGPDLQLLTETLKRSRSFYGTRYAEVDFGANKPLPPAASPLTSQFEPATPQAERVHSAASPSFPGSPRTPIAEIQPPEGLLSSPDTVIHQAKVPSTIKRLRRTKIPISSPLRQLMGGKTVYQRPPLLNLLPTAEKLAQSIIAGTLTFDEALQQDGQFIEKLNKPAGKEEEQFGASLDAQIEEESFLLGQLCLSEHLSTEEMRIVLTACSKERAKIQEYLSRYLKEEHPKLKLFGRGSMARSPVARRPIPNAAGYTGQVFG